MLKKNFYERDPAIVAKELLGKLLIRKFGKKKFIGRIVETEAYYGEDDPASRAYNGKKKFNLAMWKDPGKTFIYMVHGNWLLNIVAHLPSEVGAVLIRAVEPVKGISSKNRTDGPGRLTKAMRIDKKLNEISVISKKSRILIVNDNYRNFKIGESKRIGVSRDLPFNLRFFILNNPYVSKEKT